MELTPSDQSLPTFSGFETLEKLGEGGMCEVYRVRREGAELAIKLLIDPTRTAGERFAAEAKMLQGIRHPNVLVVHELHAEEQPPWIVMELLAGNDLEEHREAEGPMDPEVAAHWFADLAGGLAAVHAHGVRHRDLKPANIMLGHDGIPRLIDFGIARQTSSAHVTRQGFVLGTASYLPPEIFLDNDSRSIQDSEAADVYALGQTFHEMLTGVPLHPRVEGGDHVILAKIMKDKVQRAFLDPRDQRPSVPDALAAIVRRATAVDPDDRTPSAAVFEKELRDWLDTRKIAEAAPLTTIKHADLPSPPTQELPVRVGPRATPAAAARRSLDSPSATSAPVGGRVATGAAGAAGFMGIGVMALLSVTVAVLGVVALAWFAPVRPEAEVAAAVAGAHNRIAACRVGSKGDLLVELSRRGGKVAVKALSGSVRDPARSCIVAALADGAWPDGQWAVLVPIELQ